MRSAMWTWVATGVLVGVAAFAKVALGGEFATDWRVLASGQVAAVLGAFGLAGGATYCAAVMLKRLATAITGVGDRRA